MRLLTFLRRLDNQKKERIVFITTFFLTGCIVVSGILYTKSSYFFSEKESHSDALGTSTISSFFNEAKSTISLPFSAIQERFDVLSQSYKSRNFSDFFVPKND